jgi:exodeoxyribonuclease V alpha subunit
MRNEDIMSSSSDAPVERASQPPLEHLQGIVERVTYHAEDSGYTIARLKISGMRDLITIVGRFPDIHAGQTLSLAGSWREHPKYGQQFQVVHAQEMKPATLTGLEKYLGSGLIKGIGPMTAKRIVTHFGLDTLDIIEQSCSRLLEIPGIAQKRVAMIEKAWAAQKAIKEVMIFLRGHGVSTTYAVKIYKQYSDQAIEIVSRNPYQLAADIYGIGFVTADTIARNIGIAPDSDFRYHAGILYVLSGAGEDGHCFLPEHELVERVVKQLALPEHPVDPARITELIGRMAEEKQLIVQSGYGDLAEQRICYAPAFYYTEQALAARLSTFARTSVKVDLLRVQRWIDGFTQKLGITLSDEQRHAVELAASSRLLVLTGGPGCGKTFTFRCCQSGGSQRSSRVVSIYSKLCLRLFLDSSYHICLYRKRWQVLLILFTLAQIHPLGVAHCSFQRLLCTSSYVFIRVMPQCAERGYHLAISICDTLQDADRLPLFIGPALLQLGEDVVAAKPQVLVF